MQNATTLWENWKGSFPHGTSSDNHIMFGGGVGTAVYRHLTGLSMCRQSVAWGCIDVRPLPEMIHRLRSANASVQTARGTATVGWALSSGRLVVNTTVPIGSLAHVWLPSSGLRSITESGIVLWQVNGGLLRRTDVDSSIREISFEQNPYPAVKVTVASGMYSMQGTYKDWRVLHCTTASIWGSDSSFIFVNVMTACLCVKVFDVQVWTFMTLNVLTKHWVAVSCYLKPTECIFKKLHMQINFLICRYRNFFVNCYTILP